MTGDAVITLHPLHFGADENGEREVGRVDTGTFVALPAEGIALLEWLSSGLTVAEVHARFTEEYGIEPDLDDFLQAIGECGFVAAINGASYAEELPEPEPVRGITMLGGVRQERVAWLVSLPIRLLYRVIWIAAPVLMLLNPMLWPHGSDLLVFDQVLASLLVMAGIAWILVLLHEGAHAIIARALGSTGRLSLSRRLYFLVAQTDVSGVRTVPRKQRYAAILAGMTLDLAIAVGCLAVQLAGVTGAGERFARGIIYLLLFKFAYQCQIFMRTDLYYALANWLRLGNLMDDTRHLVANVAGKLIGRSPRHDMAAVPARELRIIRWYAPFYLIGSAAAIAALCLLSIPALIPILDMAIDGLSRGPGAARFWDGAGFMLITTAQLVTLVWVTVRERRPRQSTRRLP